MNNRMRITADRHPWNMKVELRLGVEAEDGSGAYTVAKPLVLEPVEDGVRVDPFVSLAPEAAQSLMDELWRVGIRPAQGEGSAGQAQAMTNHLDDMRKIAFHALKVKS